MQKDIIKFNYNNGIVFKFKNTRVAVGTLSDHEDYIIEFKTLSNDPSKRALHKVLKDKIVITGLKISPEAAFSLMVGLQELLIKDNHITLQ